MPLHLTLKAVVCLLQCMCHMNIQFAIQVFQTTFKLTTIEIFSAKQENESRYERPASQSLKAEIQYPDAR